MAERYFITRPLTAELSDTTAGIVNLMSSRGARRAEQENAFMSA